jgi:L-rhamnose-H+ transport protein
MQAILGVFFHFLGGFASGSFYMPYKKVRRWSWESYWIIGGLFSWLIVPPLAAWLTIPHFSTIISQASHSTLFYSYLFGLLWGIGGLTDGVGVRYLGVSLGSSIILGLCMVFGALVPSIYYQYFPQPGKDTIGIIAGNKWGLFVLAGLAVCIIGIIICAVAGTLKEKQLNKESTPVSKTNGNNAIEYKFALGLTLGIISGLLSACFNFGLEAGKPMATIANTIWKNSNQSSGEFLFRNNVVYDEVLWERLTFNIIYCMILNARHRSFGDYTNNKTPLLKNYLFSALAGTTWFLQFFFYGMGESKLGNGASSWILHMTFIILVANMWGLISNEWKGVSKKARTTLFIGVAVMIVSVLIVGYGNYLKSKQQTGLIKEKKYL